MSGNGRPPVVVAWEVTRACPLACRHCRAGISAVSFSLHFPDAARADAFADTPGFFAAALDGLSNLRNARQHFQLHTTVMRSNAALLPRMHRLVEELGAGAWELFFLVPTGRGRLLADEELAAGEQEQVLRWLYRLQRHSPFPVKQICAPHFRRIEAQSARERGPERLTTRLTTMSRGCLAGNGFAFVSHVGDVCGCGFLPLSVGNIRDRPFTELYQDAPLFRAFRDPSTLGGACGACEYRALCGRLSRARVRRHRRSARGGAGLRLRTDTGWRRRSVTPEQDWSRQTGSADGGSVS